LEVGVNCHNPEAQADSGRRPYQAWLNYQSDTCQEDRLSVWLWCNHRFDESSALFAAPCAHWSYWGAPNGCHS